MRRSGLALSVKEQCERQSARVSVSTLCFTVYQRLFWKLLIGKRRDFLFWTSLCSRLNRTGGNRDAGPVLSASLLLCMAASPRYESPTCSSAMGERRVILSVKVTKRDPRLSI